MKQVFVPTNPDGITYYVDTGFAWTPMYMQGRLVWLRRYWVTWPETRDGQPLDGGIYKTYFPYDPVRALRR